MNKYGIGAKYNKMTIIGKHPDNYGKRLVRCDCGKEEYKYIMHIKNNQWGCSVCSKEERVNVARRRFTTHGLSGDRRLTNIWAMMKERCYGNSGSKYYKGKGISVCLEWKDNFETFAKWAYGNGYQSDLEIDRIDNNGNYCKENCRWVNSKVQSNNRSCVNLIEWNGLRMNLSDWAKHLNMKRSALAQRYYVYKFRGDKLFSQKGGKVGNI